jgi:hypothetical protein
LGLKQQLPSSLRSDLNLDFKHVNGWRSQVLKYLISPNWLLTTARSQVGWKFESIGDLDGKQIIKYLAKNSFYNFVVLENMVIIGYVGNSAVSDLFSKHPTLSGMQKVRYAGVMWTDNENILHVTNESGTFQTPASSVKPMATFLRKILQVKVQADVYQGENKSFADHVLPGNKNASAVADALTNPIPLASASSGDQQVFDTMRLQLSTLSEEEYNLALNQLQPSLLKGLVLAEQNNLLRVKDTLGNTKQNLRLSGCLLA